MPTVTIRPVEPSDLEALDVLLESLDAQARTRRWFGGAIDIHQAAAWAAHTDRQEVVGLVAESVAGQLVGHAALARMSDTQAEVCFEVAAGWRHHGIAGRLLAELERQAARRRITKLVAEVLTENDDMLAVFRNRGPCLEHHDGFGVIEVTMTVGDGVAQPTT